MKNGKEEKIANKFDLDKMSVAKLKNMHLIRGGRNGSNDDSIVTGKTKKMQASTIVCID
jgi:hypothetical protein